MIFKRCIRDDDGLKKALSAGHVFLLVNRYNGMVLGHATSNIGKWDIVVEEKVFDMCFSRIVIHVDDYIRLTADSSYHMTPVLASEAYESVINAVGALVS